MIYSNLHGYNTSKITNKDEYLNKSRKGLFEYFNNFNKIIEFYMQVSNVSTSKKASLICKSFVAKMSINLFFLSLWYTQDY